MYNYCNTMILKNLLSYPQKGYVTTTTYFIILKTSSSYALIVGFFVKIKHKYIEINKLIKYGVVENLWKICGNMWKSMEGELR